MASPKTVFPDSRLLSVAYGLIAWLPVCPQLDLNLRLDMSALSFRKSSYEIRHAKAAEGQYPHLFSGLYLDEPSARKLIVARYLLSKL